MGISLERDSYILEDVNIPLTSYNQETTISKTKKGSLELDGVDKKLKIGIEFVSSDDYEAWENKKEGVWSSVSDYDFLTTAKVLRDGNNKSPNDVTVARRLHISLCSICI